MQTRSEDIFAPNLTLWKPINMLIELLVILVMPRVMESTITVIDQANAVLMFMRMI